MRIKSLFFLCLLVVLLTVSCFAAEPVILAQPQNIYFPVGTEFPVSGTFSVLASGDDLSYQWQINEGNGWADYNSDAARRPSFRTTITSNFVGGNRLYRVIVSNNDGQVVSSAASVSVGAYLMDSLPQLLSFLSEIANNIFSWCSSVSICIVSEPLLLFTVGFLALGGSIAVFSRLLSRS